MTFEPESGGASKPNQIFGLNGSRLVDRMPVRTSLRIRDKLAQYAADPRPLANNVKALAGASGLLRMRVGDWRILFTEGGHIIRIVRVAPRGSAYDRL